MKIEIPRVVNISFLLPYLLYLLGCVAWVVWAEVTRERWTCITSAFPNTLWSKEKVGTSRKCQLRYDYGCASVSVYMCLFMVYLCLFMYAFASLVLILTLSYHPRHHYQQLVPGDIVRISASSASGAVPADIRVIKVTGDCTVDTRSLFGDEGELRVLNEQASTNSTEYLESLCMIFTGSRLIEGKVEGVVLHTGENTCISKLIRSKIWPLPEVILTV
jgi:hypothetical protein